MVRVTHPDFYKFLLNNLLTYITPWRSNPIRPLGKKYEEKERKGEEKGEKTKGGEEERRGQKKE